MHIFSSSVCHLIHLHSPIPWFRLACSCCTFLPIVIGIGAHPFKSRRSSFLYISCLTFFWLSCRSFPQLQGKGHTRNCHTGHIQLPVSWCRGLVSHIGIYGASGFRKGKDIVSSERGLFRKMVFLDMYSAE